MNNNFSPYELTDIDQIHVFVSEQGLSVPEEYYYFFSPSKVRDYSIAVDFKRLKSDGVKTMSAYDDLAYKYQCSVMTARVAVSSGNELLELIAKNKI